MKVAFVGFAKHDPVPEDLEVWTVSHAYRYDIRIDRLFEMHRKSDMIQRNYYASEEVQKAHVKFLEAEHDFPIYMLEKYDGFPASVKYPLMDTRKLFTSTFCYMAALAVLEMPKSVDVYGFDMDRFEYKYQRPDALYWIGRMEGKGISVNVHGKLLPDKKLYGYERTHMVGIHALTMNLNRYKKQQKKNLARAQKTVNLTKAKEYETQAVLCEGAIQAIEHLIAECNLEE